MNKIKFINEYIWKQMKKSKNRLRKVSILALSSTLIFLTGCHIKSDTKQEELIKLTPTTSPITAPIDNSDKTSSDSTSSKDMNNTVEQGENTVSTALQFPDLTNLQFVYSSGAGAWATLLTINEDGSFEGVYSDSDMGDMGDGYPNGTTYISNFSGKFTVPKSINEYTDSMTIESISLEQEVGTEEIIDGIKYVYSEPYGIWDAKDIYIYHKDTPVINLPEEYRGWVGYYDSEEYQNELLPFIGLYNVATQSGFSSYDISAQLDSLIEEVNSLEDVEHNAMYIEERIEQDELTQLEYNVLSKNLYDLWDNELNRVWKLLKDTLDKDKMNQLLEEQREWIIYKEKEIASAASQYEGGSMKPMIEHLKAAELTKIRVYELHEYLN